MKWLKNKTANTKTYRGLEFLAGEFTQIPANQLASFQSDLAVIADLLSGDAVMSATGNTELAGNASAQIDFLKSIELGTKEVITQLEKDDKTLGLASLEGEFSGQECVMEIEIPGTPGGVGRYVKEGYAFSDVFIWGMRVVRVALVDHQYLYAGVPGFYPATPTEAGIPGVEGLTWEQVMPNGVELGNYCDPELPEGNRGWRFWAEEGGQGGVDIDNLAGYGPLLSGTKLILGFWKPEGSPAAKVAANIQWGIPA